MIDKLWHLLQEPELCVEVMGSRAEKLRLESNYPLYFPGLLITLVDKILGK